MKKFFTSCIIILAAVFNYAGASAQDKPKILVSTARQKGETVRYTLLSSKPFIYGNDRYVLYIGNKEFSRYEQSKHSGKGYLTFLLPIADFRKTAEGANMYLTYGHVELDDNDMEQLAKGRKCWSLGRFTHNLLK